MFFHVVWLVGLVAWVVGQLVVSWLVSWLVVAAQSGPCTCRPPDASRQVNGIVLINVVVAVLLEKMVGRSIRRLQGMEI